MHNIDWACCLPSCRPRRVYQRLLSMQDLNSLASRYADALTATAAPAGNTLGPVADSLVSARPTACARDEPLSLISISPLLPLRTARSMAYTWTPATPWRLCRTRPPRSRG